MKVAGKGSSIGKGDFAESHGVARYGLKSWLMQPFEMGGSILTIIMGAYNVNA